MQDRNDPAQTHNDVSEASPSVAKNQERSLATRLRQIWLLCVAMCAIYGLSLGPACWVLTRCNAQKHDIHFRVVSKVYEPVLVSIIRSPMWARGPIIWYLELGAASDARFIKDWPEGIGWSKPGYSYTLLSMSVAQP